MLRRAQHERPQNTQTPLALPVRRSFKRRLGACRRERALINKSFEWFDKLTTNGKYKYDEKYHHYSTYSSIYSWHFIAKLPFWSGPKYEKTGFWYA